MLCAWSLTQALAASAPLPPRRPVMDRDGRAQLSRAGAADAAARDGAARAGGAQENDAQQDIDRESDPRGSARQDDDAQGGADGAARSVRAGLPPAPSRARRVPAGGVPYPLPRPAELAEGSAADPSSADETPIGERSVTVASAPSAPDWPGAAAGGDDTPGNPGFPPVFAPRPVPAPAVMPDASALEPDAEQYDATGSGEGLPAPCAALVRKGLIAAVPERGLAVPRGCSLPDPVRFTAIRLKGGALIEMKPAAIVGCATAAAVADWMREDVAPAVEALGSRLEAVNVASSFECRSRNRRPGARLSEHGFGRALDVGGFELADRGKVEVKGGGLPVALQARMRETACARFMTVLGPGSDGYHEDHVHVDLAQRANASTYCRWRIKGEGPAVAVRGTR